VTDSGNQIVYCLPSMNQGPYPNHLAEYMLSSGIRDPDLANKVGVSKQQIFNLRRWHRKLTVEWAKRLAPHLKVSWERLITGAPAQATDQEREELLAFFETMDEAQRKALLAMARVVTRRETVELAPSDSPTKPGGCVMPLRRM
jgi:plasmid maintenance system antidote protein VapI